MKAKQKGQKAARKTTLNTAPRRKTEKELSREKLEKDLVDMTVPEKRVAMDKWLTEHSE